MVFGDTLLRTRLSEGLRPFLFIYLSMKKITLSILFFFTTVFAIAQSMVVHHKSGNIVLPTETIDSVDFVMSDSCSLDTTLLHTMINDTIRNVVYVNDTIRNEVSSKYIVNGDLNADGEWVLGRNSVKNSKRLTFSGKIRLFDALIVGHGREGAYSGSWLLLDKDSIHVYNRYASNSISYFHGLNITNDIKLEIWRDYGATTLSITSNGNTFEKQISWLGDIGEIYVKSISSEFYDCTFKWKCSKLNNGIWLFGDSYFNLTANNRWTSYLFKNGYQDFCLNAYPGEGSKNAYLDLINLLTISKPRTIIWCLGMNDHDDKKNCLPNSEWLEMLNNVIAICREHNIELILSTIPPAHGGDASGNGTKLLQNKYKNEIVKKSGYRYIDFAEAVGADETTGLWYDGMLYSDGIHPNVPGAIALYNQFIKDYPEIME